MPKGTDLTTIEQILQAITDSGSGAQEWLNSLHDEQYNEVMEILAVDIDFEGAIEKEEGRWALRNVEEHIGTIENFKIDVLDDGEERQIPVKVYDDETYTSSHRETFWIQKEGEFYYLIIDGQKGQKVGIKGEARALSKIFSVCEFLDKKCKEVERTEELTLQEAIEKGDFNRIIQIIKQDDELSDEMIIQLMRLSKIDGKGKAVTFLQAMLGHDGIYDSTRAEYILNRGKELLSDFECKALFQLCDDNLSAQQLLFCKGREHLVKYSPVRTTTTVILKGVDTHSETIHASVDISATRLFRRFAERYPELELSPEVKEKGVITPFTRDHVFSNAIHDIIKELQDKLILWQSLSDQDLRNRLITGMLSSTVEDTRFMLEAALGLVKDSLRGTMTGVGRGFRVSFVEQIGVGLTLKEVLAITYDALSDKDHLASTSESDLISSFHQLIVHLYQTKREYNDDTTPEGRLQADDNKCTGGAMNHIVHSLQGINDLVDVPVNLNLSVIKIEAKCHAINFIKRDLSTVDGLRDAVSRARTGAKFSELLPPYYKELLEKTKVEIRSMHDDHFKDDKYLEVVEDTLSNDLFIGNSALEAELGPLDYSSLFTPNDMAQAMIHRVLPLYTKTDQGYRYTFQLIYEQNPDNANSIAILCLDQQQYQAVVDYRIFASLDMAQLATQSPNLKAQILRFAIVNRDIKTARDLINGMSGDELATQDGRGKTALHVTVQVGNAELAGLVMHKMNKNQLVIQDKNENTALYYAVWNNCFDIAKLLIDGMSSEQLGLQDNKGRTLLHICVYCSKYEMAALLISKMNGEQLAVKNQAGETALKVMNDCVFIPQQIELILLMLDKMNDEQIALPDQRGMNFFHYMRAMHPTVVTALIAKLPVNYWLSEANRLIRGDEETNEILYWNNINDLIIADALLHDQHHSACEVMRKVVTVFPLETISEAVHLKIAIYLNSENKYGVSNFRKIIKSGDSEMVKIALAYGADPLSSRGSSTMTDMADSLAAANSTPERESIRNSVKDASTNPSYLKGGYIGMIERNQVMCRARHR